MIPVSHSSGGMKMPVWLPVSIKMILQVGIIKSNWEFNPWESFPLNWKDWSQEKTTTIQFLPKILPVNHGLQRLNLFPLVISIFKRSHWAVRTYCSGSIPRILMEMEIFRMNLLEEVWISGGTNQEQKGMRVMVTDLFSTIKDGIINPPFVLTDFRSI